MYARVVRFEGATPEALQESASQISRDAENGPPDGVPAREMLLLTDTDNGRALAVILFETEDDYRQGDETLNAMSPPGEGMGSRTAVEKYEVAARVEAS